MMKNIYTIAGTLLLLGAVLSCTREKALEPEQAGQMRFAVTVEGTTKASMTSADLNQFYLKVTGPDNAFSFYDTIVKEGETWKASSKRLLWKDEKSSITYAAASYGALGPDYLNVPVTDALFSSGATMGLLTDQGTQAKLNAADLLTMKETTLAFADTEDGIVPVTLKHGLAKVNFKLTLAPEYFDNGVGLEGSPITGLALSGVHTRFFFMPLTGEVSIPDGASKGAVIPFQSSYEPGTEAAKPALAVAEAILVPEAFAAGALTLYFTVAGKDFTWTNSTPLTFEQGGEYTVPVSIDYNTVPSGPVTPDPAPTPLSGVFTVSAGVPTGKTVQFSPGNLRYASGAWSFFDHQYDYYATYSADAWDKFGWSNSTNNFGMSTSTDNAVYRGDLVDWGTVPGIGTGWFTLSNNEWLYLFNTRSASTVNSVANARYAKGKVNGVYGIILFPDTYTHPTGVTLPVGINNVDNTGWNGNNYSAADWTAMETAGCVFLPAAGYREGTSVQSAGSSCSYRSSTRLTSTTDMVNYVYFTATNLNVSGSNSGRYGQCIRLVCDATAADPADPTAIDLSTLSAATTADIGKVVGADGKIYANVAAAKAASTTACAIIAFVGSATGEDTYTHGLAIAMKDAGDLLWKTSYGSNDNPNQYTDPDLAIAAKESGSALSSSRNNSTWPAFEAALANSITEDLANGISKAAPAGTSGWFLPSLYQWNMIVKGLSGQSADLSYSENDDYKASSLNTKITAAGGTGLQSDRYWSSTECDGYNAWFFLADYGCVQNGPKDLCSYFVRSAFAF